MARTIAWAMLIAGTLDILAAIVMSLVRGNSPADMLRFVASGPFPAATEWGGGGALLGLAVHFVLMAVMAAVFIFAARSRPALTAHPIRWGVIYGVITYVVMNLVVVPSRWPATFPPAPLSAATQLLFHVALVGIPIALIAASRSTETVANNSH